MVWKTSPKDVPMTSLEDTLSMCGYGALKTSLQVVLKISFGDNLETGIEDALIIYAFYVMETVPIICLEHQLGYVLKIIIGNA